MEFIDSLITYIVAFVDWIGSALDAFFTYLTDTIVVIAKDGIEWLMIKLTIMAIDTKIFFLEISWSVASGVLAQFQISSVVSSYVSGLSPSVAYVADRLGFFDGLNLVLQAGITNYVMRLVGA